MTTAFEDLPVARKEPFAGADGLNLWSAEYTVGAGFGLTYATVKAIVHADKASDLRLRREQRGNYMVGMLVDKTGTIYGATGTSLGVSPTAGQDLMLSRVDVARARLIDLASEWRMRGATYGPGAGVLIACASELDTVVIELLSGDEEIEPEVEDE